VDLIVMSLKVGQLVLRNKFILSPLESVSDVGFRQLCYNNGAALTWTEMIRSQAISRGNNAALDLIDTFDPTCLTGVQILAKTSDDLLRSLHQLENLSSNGKRPHFKNIAAIDLNFGCPSPDVIREGAGPALLCRRNRLHELLSTLVKWKNHPANCLQIGAVGCKIRLGKNQTEQSQKVYLRVAAVANEVGLDYLTVHARHAKQKSSEPPTWSAIREIKEVASMPVIANGNVACLADALQLESETGCDGFMVARAAIRNPWIFRYFASGKEELLKNAALRPEQKSDVFGREFLDDRYWPSEEEVLQVIEAYNSMEQQLPAYGEASSAVVADGNTASSKFTTKAKYRKFHGINFGRILAASRSKDARAAPFIPPKTIHI